MAQRSSSPAEARQHLETFHNSKKRFLVIGGAGFLGSYLCHELLSQGHHVRVLDRAPFTTTYVAINKTKLKVSEEELRDRCEEIIADIRDYEKVSSACKDVDIVFHTASLLKFWTDSILAPKTERNLVHEVNVGGTQNVIRACKENRVPRLIYTSTCNVTIDGVNPVQEGVESDPFPASYMDCYSSTKAQAEKLIIAANSETLETAVIRPVGIYGEGELNHFFRAIKYSKYFMAMMGSPKALTDWVYVENLVHGHLLLAAHLAHDSKAYSSQVYYISDGEFINNYQIIKPFIEAGNGYSVPVIWIPMSIMFYLAFFMEIMCALLYRTKCVFWAFVRVIFTLLALIPMLSTALTKSSKYWKDEFVMPVYPTLTRIEVYKVGVDNYFSIEKARKELGYEPLVHMEEAFKRTAEYFKQAVQTSNAESKVFKKFQ